MSGSFGAGREALARGAWEQARSCLAATIEEDETPDALEAAATAAWWLDDASTATAARKRAYLFYRRQGDPLAAARLATALGSDHCGFGAEPAVGRGWIQRAERLLEGLERSPEHGWLAVVKGHVALMVDLDTVAARSHIAEAGAVGHALGLVDLEMVAIAQEGVALVNEGYVAEGMRLLDESAAAVLAGELPRDQDMAMVFCYLLHACEQVRDFERALQWCGRVKEADEPTASKRVFSLARAHYAGLLVWRGAWREAEAELEASISGLGATRPAVAAEAMVRLAELRRRQGRLHEAAALIGKVESTPVRMLGDRLALLGRAELALDQGDAAAAASLAERFLRGISAQRGAERLPALEILVRADLARSDWSRAQLALAEMQAVTTLTNPLRGLLRHAEGMVTAANAELDTARCRFEDATALFEGSGGPFEAARSRVELARVLGRLDHLDAACREATAALRTLHGLGATGEGARAEALLVELASMAGPPPEHATDAESLTARELEVLRLVAEGHSNEETARTLVLSVRTVERHMANIYAKIGATGKAARVVATSHALRCGLLGAPSTSDFGAGGRGRSV